MRLVPPPPVEAKVEKPAAQTWEEFQKAAEADVQRPWVLKPFLPAAPGLVLVLGDAKSGKTTWTSWLVGEALRAGKRVLFIEEEGSRAILRDRLSLFVDAGPADGLRIAFRHKHWLVGNNPGDVDGLAELFLPAWEHQPDLIVLDSLHRLMVGDENEADLMRRVVERLDHLSRQTNALIVLLHHTRKAGKEGRSGGLTSADSRGSGELLGGASVIVGVEKVKAEGPGEVRFDVSCLDSWFEPFATQHCVVDVKDSVLPADRLTATVDEGDEVKTKLDAEDVAHQLLTRLQTVGVGERVSPYQLAGELGLSCRRATIAQAAGMLHDWGYLEREGKAKSAYTRTSKAISVDSTDLVQPVSPYVRRPDGRFTGARRSSVFPTVPRSSDPPEHHATRPAGPDPVPVYRTGRGLKGAEHPEHRERQIEAETRDLASEPFPGPEAVELHCLACGQKPPQGDLAWCSECWSRLSSAQLPPNSDPPDQRG